MSARRRSLGTDPAASAEPRTRKRLSPEQRREEILDAARAAFRETGVHGTTMGDIADRAGITQTHLYRHFNKDDLYHRAVLDPLGELEAQVVRDTKALAEQPDITHAQMLEHFHELCLVYFVELVPLLRGGRLSEDADAPWFYHPSPLPRWRELIFSVIADISGWDTESLDLEVLVQAFTGLYSAIALVGEIDGVTLDVGRTAATLTSMFAPTRIDAKDRKLLREAAERVADAPEPPTAAIASSVHEEQTKRRLARAERQASIIIAAQGLFCEVGLSGARSLDLAERAGITEAFLYRLFGSKEELYLAAIEEPVAAALDALANATRALAATHDGVAFLLEFNALGLRFFQSSGALFATAVQADLERSARFFRESAEPQLDAVGEVLVEKMGYDPARVDSRMAWTAILGAHWGVSVEAAARGVEMNVDAVSVHLARDFAVGLTSTTSGG